jgi:hypothetical protein
MFGLGDDVVGLVALHTSWQGVEGVMSYGVTSFDMSVNNSKIVGGEMSEG